ncbi:MAG: zf-HC2 domain-containing protein [Actinomycetota bacterium]|nr:zf-HC2 domain-containing protein [Actinomycetota bacterium]
MNEMSKCDDVQELLSAYIDNELADDERRWVGAHLDECTECRATVAALQEAIAAVKSLDDFEVPPELTSNLRGIEPGKRSHAVAPAKRWWASPRVAVFVATGAVAAIALVSLLTLSDVNITGNRGATQEATSPARDKAMPQQSVPAGESLLNASKSEAHDIDSTDLENSAGTEGVLGSGEKTLKDGAVDDELLLRGLPDDKDAHADAWPKILASSKNYTPASIETLAGELHDSSNGLYTVEDAGEKRAAFVDKIVEEVSAQGGEGEKTRSPLNAILDRTKRAALPIYVEKAKFENKACLVIAIKWGFGGGDSRLYKTSLYVTNLSGWTIFHYTSK